MTEWNFTAPPATPTINVSFDLETFLIAPLVQAPNVVAMGFSVDGGKVQVVAANDTSFDRVVEALFCDPAVRLYGHNVRFDLIALLAHGARFGLAHWPVMIFGAVQADRVTCTLIREKLLTIAYANPKDTGRRFDLGTCCARWKTPTQPNKEDPYRMTWGELAHLPVSEYPADATKYLVEDVQACRELFVAQSRRPDYLVDQYRQVRAALSLGLMSAHGFATDRPTVDQVYAETETDLRLARELCQEHGLVRPNGVRDTKAAQARLVTAYAAKGLTPPRNEPTEMMAAYNKEGSVQLDEDACAKSGDPVLRAYAKFAQSQTLLAKVARLKYPVIQPTFDPLMETGRTSCTQGKDPKVGQPPTAYGSQVQNPPREVLHTCTLCRGMGCEACGGKGEIPATGVRECYRARPGCVLLDIDYNTMELRALAQVERWWFGTSALGDILNDPERCPHVEMGATIRGIPAEAAYALKRTDPKDFKALRQMAKAANFGTPGGMGKNRLAEYAQDTYNVELSVEQADEIIKATKVIYPERGPYLRRIGAWADSGRFRFTHPYSGRVRGGLNFTNGANNPFQALAADAAKEAMWRVVVHCYVLTQSALYGCRPVAFVHDELIVEAPERRYEAAAEELQCQWVGGAAHVIPDITIFAEPSAMRRWDKAAGDPVFHADGHLAIFGEQA